MIAQKLISIRDSYLKHRSHVYNINEVFPIVKESFQGTYIELDFSENIAIKPKFEVQEAHFSGKQYTLHCSIVEPGMNEYVYHLCDDTKHDPVFVNEVLEDIFTKRNNKYETVIIKSDIHISALERSILVALLITLCLFTMNTFKKKALRETLVTIFN